MLRKTGLFSRLARAKASSDHGYQSTGLVGVLQQIGARLPVQMIHAIPAFMEDFY